MKKKIFIFFILFLIPVCKLKAVDISYQTHVQDIGWMNYVNNNTVSGTTGRAKQVEAIKIKVEEDGQLINCIQYQAHVQDIGWMNWVNDNELSGTTGRAKQVEALRIKVKDEYKDKYSIYYRVHVSDIGWMNYVKDGELAGTTGRAKQIEAIQIKIVEKDSYNVSINYASHTSDGWLDYVNNGEQSGTTGKNKKIDLFKIKINNFSELEGNIVYQSYITPDGWLSEVYNDQSSGKDGNTIEALKIYLTDDLANKFNIFYRVHVSDIGWMGWTSNGKLAGTIGYFKAIEAVEIKLQQKDFAEIAISNDSFRESINKVQYSSHVSDIGWMDYVEDGSLSGTTGRAKQVEAFKIKLSTKLSGNVEYSSYVARRGWQNFVNNDSISGTTGLVRKIEAIKIKLNGEISNYYDIYYRVHVSNIGWLSWAKNGNEAGCLNSLQQIESIEIKLIKKGIEFKEDTTKSLRTGEWKNNNTNYYDTFGNKVTGFRLIDGIKYYFDGDGDLVTKKAKKVIDVSSWQGDINWNTIKRNEDVDEAIIRVGWGTSYADECGTDSKLDRNINEVQRLGIPYGVYIYAYAETNSAAEKEADFVISKLQQYNAPKSTYVWYDAEIYSISRDTYNNVINAFINRMKSRGYNNVGVYGGVRQLDTSSGNLNTSTIRSYPIWVSQYYKKLQYTGDYLGWQYASDEQIDGINGNVDVSVFKKN